MERQRVKFWEYLDSKIPRGLLPDNYRLRHRSRIKRLNIFWRRRWRLIRDSWDGSAMLRMNWNPSHQWSRRGLPRQPPGDNLQGGTDNLQQHNIKVKDKLSFLVLVLDPKSPKSSRFNSDITSSLCRQPQRIKNFDHFLTTGKKRMTYQAYLDAPGPTRPTGVQRISCPCVFWVSRKPKIAHKARKWVWGSRKCSNVLTKIDKNRREPTKIATTFKTPWTSFSTT